MESKLKEILEWAFCVIIAVILALLVRYFIGTPTIVQQVSMNTTLQPNQRLILNRLTRTFKKTYKRGDIITFEAPSKSTLSAYDVNVENPVAIYDNEREGIWEKFSYYVLELNKTSYIKRVIGVAGDHIKIENGVVYVNGAELYEPYLDEGVTTTVEGLGVYSDIIVPEGTVFVLGDNRTKSTDSRMFGCIPIEKIEGKVWIRFWPFSEFGKVD